MSLSCLIPFSSSPSHGEFQAPQHDTKAPSNPTHFYFQIHLLPLHRSTIYQMLAGLPTQHPVYSLCIYTWSFLGLEWLFLLFLLRNASYTAAAAKSLQSCPTLCDPIDSSPPGSPVPGILQARTLEWVAISFSNA